MKTWTFETANGNRFTATARDVDRARCAAKRLALDSGATWKGAKLVGISNSL